MPDVAMVALTLGPPSSVRDYAWLKELDRALLEELFTFACLEQVAHVVSLAPMGGSKR